MEKERAKVYVETTRVPYWLIGMPDEWWEFYFENVLEIAISPVWGNA